MPVVRSTVVGAVSSVDLDLTAPLGNRLLLVAVLIEGNFSGAFQQDGITAGGVALSQVAVNPSTDATHIAHVELWRVDDSDAAFAALTGVQTIAIQGATASRKYVAWLLEGIDTAGTAVVNWNDTSGSRTTSANTAPAYLPGDDLCQLSFTATNSSETFDAGFVELESVNLGSPTSKLALAHLSAPELSEGGVIYTVTYGGNEPDVTTALITLPAHPGADLAGQDVRTFESEPDGSGIDMPGITAQNAGALRRAVRTYRPQASAVQVVGFVSDVTLGDTTRVARARLRSVAVQDSMVPMIGDDAFNCYMVLHADSGTANSDTLTLYRRYADGTLSGLIGATVADLANKSQPGEIVWHDDHTIDYLIDGVAVPEISGFLVPVAERIADPSRYGYFGLANNNPNGGLASLDQLAADGIVNDGTAPTLDAPIGASRVAQGGSFVLPAGQFGDASAITIVAQLFDGTWQDLPLNGWTFDAAARRVTADAAVVVGDYQLRYRATDVHGNGPTDDTHVVTVVEQLDFVAPIPTITVMVGDPAPTIDLANHYNAAIADAEVLGLLGAPGASSITDLIITLDTAIAGEVDVTVLVRDEFGQIVQGDFQYRVLAQSVAALADASIQISASQVFGDGGAPMLRTASVAPQASVLSAGANTDAISLAVAQVEIRGELMTEIEITHRPGLSDANIPISARQLDGQSTSVPDLVRAAIGPISANSMDELQLQLGPVVLAAASVKVRAQRFIDLVVNYRPHIQNAEVLVQALSVSSPRVTIAMQNALLSPLVASLQRPPDIEVLVRPAGTRLVITSASQR
ncbi:MAG: hypothetical protein AAF515_05125 [Pseudomonadota bacterium]